MGGGGPVRRSEAYRAAEDVVRSLGVTCANLSVRQFILALELIHQDEDLLNSITTKLHPLMAERLPNASRESVEKNLRDARDIILKRGDPERLREVVGYTIRRYPSVGDMLDAIDYYMQRNGLWPEEKR
jgi:hypothetical protein